MTKRRAHWSLKTSCDKLPSNIARKTKITSGPSFFKGANVGIIVDSIDVMAALEDFMKVYENEEEQRLVEEEEIAEEEIAEEKEKTAKEAGRRKRGHRKKRPTKKRVDE